MNTRPGNYYELLAFGLGNVTFQQFVDKFKTKYNKEQTDGFAWDPEVQLDYTYEQLEVNLGITTLPTYVDSESDAYDRSLGGFVIGSNKIPTQKARYAMNRKILRERMLAVKKFGQAALTGESRDAILNLMFESTDKLLQANVNARTHQRMRICSTGKFTIDAENNPQGLTGLTFDFGIPAENMDELKTTERWWTKSEHVQANEGAASDPLQYLKNKVKMMRKKVYPAGHFEMSQDLFDDLLTHSKVLKRIGLALNPMVTDESAIVAAKNLTDDVLKSQIERIIGCKIVTRDSVAAVDKYDADSKSLKPVSIENFAPCNVSFVPDGQIGTIKSVQQLTMDDPAERVAWFDGNRTLLTQRYNSATKTMYVQSETSILLVPQMPRYMQIYTVTA